MKLLVRELWFSHNVDDTVRVLLKIPQLGKLLGEGYSYDGEMRPRGIKISPGYWPADPILGLLPHGEGEVRLVLTSVDLQGDYGRIHGKGYDHKAIASNSGYMTNAAEFEPWDHHFQAMAFGEIGHALGLEHHNFDSSNPCEMSHNKIPGPRWKSLDDIRFCDDCYRQIAKN